MIVFPAPPALSLVMLNSLPFPGPHALHSSVPLFKPLPLVGMPLSLFPVPQPGKGHLLLEALCNHSRQRVPSLQSHSSPCIPLSNAGLCFFCYCLCACLYSSPAFPSCPGAKGDCSTLGAGIISSSAVSALASSGEACYV